MQVVLDDRNWVQEWGEREVIEVNPPPPLTKELFLVSDIYTEYKIERPHGEILADVEGGTRGH